MLMACTSPIECNNIQEITCDIWYLDSGCSNHMTCKLNLFSSLDNSVQTDVTLGNNVQATVLGKGTVDFLTKQGKIKYITDVYHVEGLKHNLLIVPSKSPNDKQSLLSIKDSSRHEREDKYKSCIQGRN